MAIVATRRRNSKPKSNGKSDGQPAGGGGAHRGARSKKVGRGVKSPSLKRLPAGGVRLARVPLSDLVGESPSTIVSVDGWECYGHSERIHIRPVGTGISEGFTKACDAIELWARPMDGGCPTAYLEVRFCLAGEPVSGYVLLRIDPNEYRDGMCKLSIGGGGIEQCVQMDRLIPAGFGEALLQRVFGTAGRVAAVAKAIGADGPWRAPLQALIREAKAFEERARPILAQVPDHNGRELDPLEGAPQWIFDLWNEEWNRLHAAKDGQHEKAAEAELPEPIATKAAGSKTGPELSQPGGDGVRIPVEDLELLRPVILDRIGQQVSTAAALGFLLRLLDDAGQAAFRPLAVHLQDADPGQPAAGTEAEAACGGN